MRAGGIQGAENNRLDPAYLAQSCCSVHSLTAHINKMNGI